MEKLLILFLTLILTLAANPVYAERGFFVSDGTHLTWYDEDTSTVQPKSWQIRLFPKTEKAILTGRRGLPARGWWGLISNKTAEGALKELNNGQKTEIMFEQFFGKGSWGNDTYFKPSGLIAVFDKTSTKEPKPGTVQAGIERVRGVLDRIKEKCGKITEMLPGKEKVKGMAAAVKEYAKNLRDLCNQQKKLESILEEVRRTGNDAAGELSRVASEVDRLESRIEGNYKHFSKFSTGSQGGGAANALSFSKLTSKNWRYDESDVTFEVRNNGAVPVLVMQSPDMQFRDISFDGNVLQGKIRIYPPEGAACTDGAGIYANFQMTLGQNGTMLEGSRDDLEIYRPNEDAGQTSGIFRILKCQSRVIGTVPMTATAGSAR